VTKRDYWVNEKLLNARMGEMESWKLSIQLVVEEYNRENMERDSE
jgi:hypothetical protein